MTTEWQSIETAPKDGTEILLWDSSLPEQILIGKWNNGFYSDDYKVDATHWMKIQKPPLAEWQEKGMCCETFWDVVRIVEGKTYYIEDIPYNIIFCPWCGEKVYHE